MSGGNEVKIRIGLEKPGVDPGLKETDENLKHVGETASKVGAAAKPAIDSIGVSAKQTAAALRGVPAQFTDIFTSLQGGQAPLTVLLQQGGQLKDMFGGIGPAASAMGSYVAAMITPVTLAGASVAALAVAAYKGSEESRELANSITLSGNAAGQSVDSIYRLAEGIEASTRTTKGAAAEAVSQAAASGRVSAANLALVAEAAVLVHKATGQAVSEVVAQFAELGKSPVEASQKLQAQYGYLTVEVYRQIKALEDQGRTFEAGELAQQAFSKALTERSNKIIDDLGLAEKAWMGLGNVAKKAWDEMLGLGRKETLEEKLAAAIRARDGYTEERGNGNLGDKKVPGNPAMQSEVESLQRQIEQRDRQAGQQKASIEATKAAVAWESEEIKYLDKKQQKAAEILRVKNLMTQAGKDQAYQAVILAQIEEKYAEKGPKKKADDPELEAMLLRSDEARRQRKELEDELKAIEQANEKKARAEQIVTNYDNEAKQTVERIRRQNELIGVSEREVKVREAIYKVEDQAAAVKDRITEQIKDETDRSAALAAVDADLANKKLLVAEATRQAYDAARTFDAGWSDALSKYKDNASNAADTARNAFSGMTDAMEGAIKSFVKNGKIDFESFGDAVIDTLIDIQMQSLRTNVLAPLMESGGNWLTKLFSGGSSGGFDTGAGSGFDSALWGVNSQHTGGIVGTSEGSGRRFVPSSVFRAAPRFHTGGIVGDEVPIIAKRGEGVFTPGQMQAMGGGSSVNISIYGAPSQPRTETRQNSSGGMDIDLIFEQAESYMSRRIAQGSGLAPVIEQTYGVNRAAGAWR